MDTRRLTKFFEYDIESYKFNDKYKAQLLQSATIGNRLMGTSPEHNSEEEAVFHFIKIIMKIKELSE